MYTHNNSAFSRAATSEDPLAHFPMTATPMHSSAAPQLNPFDSVQETRWQLNSELSMSNNNNNNNNYCSSGSSTPSSLASCETQRVTATSLMQRSVSSHSLLHKNHNSNSRSSSGVQLQYPFSALFAELLNSDDGPVRRVYSTGDLQRINGMQHYPQSDSPLSSESSLIIEAMSRASPYSPEEKKVRIERYRSKRNQRNFNKKIKYACRKTLADSRPRIRGRFARNDEIVMNPPSVQWSQFGAGEEEDEEDENWANFFDSLDPANVAQEQQDSSSFRVFY